MEWIIAIVCMVPAAISDIKYRSVSLESCVAGLMAGAAVFILWGTRAHPAEVLGAGFVVICLSAAAWAAGKKGPGDGDWWFVAGISAALSTLGIHVPLVAVTAGMGSLAVCHVMLCVRRPGLSFPRRLYMHVKRKGEKFRVDMATGDIADIDTHNIAVYPGLPMVTFLVGGAIAACVIR